MSLFEYLTQGTHLYRKKGRLLQDITAEPHGVRRAGTIVCILMKNKDGTYHAEDGDWACKLEAGDFDFIHNQH